jgi:hypothetical protein
MPGPCPLPCAFQVYERERDKEGPGVAEVRGSGVAPRISPGNHREPAKGLVPRDSWARTRRMQSAQVAPSPSVSFVAASSSFDSARRDGGDKSRQKVPRLARGAALDESRYGKSAGGVNVAVSCNPPTSRGFYGGFTAEGDEGEEGLRDCDRSGKEGCFHRRLDRPGRRVSG